MEIPTGFLREILNAGLTVFVPYVVWRTERSRRVLDQILDEARKTNSRISKLEAWQDEHEKRTDRNEARAELEYAKE